MKISKRDAEKVMQEIVDGKCESEVDGNILNAILEQHHNVYLRAMTLRSLK
ncbi:hypothetical protein NVP1121O_247 [Vibrio phage 1.121.O._10N.286.46.C4]|nr:hypothetical protein NVP1121O_247 [Vibrio phage 1.121.O._10N.286.46.C4]